MGEQVSPGSLCSTSSKPAMWHGGEGGYPSVARMALLSRNELGWNEMSYLARQLEETL